MPFSAELEEIIQEVDQAILNIASMFADTEDQIQAIIQNLRDLAQYAYDEGYEDGSADVIETMPDMDFDESRD